ncbi:MAG TPA: hypothetical protein VF235_04545, partial [Actinomycetota bacterium]
VLLLALACGAAAAPAPTAPADAFEAGSTTAEIDVADLTDGALDPEGLADLLASAGFADATVRTWTTSATAGIRRVEARALRFADGEGAAAYLDWIEEHPADLVGGATRVAEDPYLLFAHEPGGCCPNKDVTQVLAAWAAGDVVWTLTVTGPEASEATATEIASAIEGSDDGA